MRLPSTVSGLGRYSASTYLDHRDFLFCGVVARFVALGLRQDAKKGRVARSHPMPEGKSTDEYSDPGQDGIEEIEGADCTHADQVKERALDTQVGERLVQAFEYAIGSLAVCFYVCHVRPHQVSGLNELESSPLNSP